MGVYAASRFSMLYRPRDSFEIKFILAVAFSAALHLGAVLAVFFYPGSKNPVNPSVIVTELIDFPRGPGLGPQAPTQKIAALQKPDAPSKRKDDAKVKANEMRLPDRVKPETRARSAQDRQRQEAIDRIRQLVNVGGGGTADESGGTGIYGVYLSNIKKRIYSAWAVPGGLSEQEKNKPVVLIIRIAANGTIQSKQITTSSGNASLDRSALNAIEKASPVPPPPPIMAQKLATEGMIVNFEAKKKKARR